MLSPFAFSTSVNTAVREVNLLNPPRCQTSLAILSAKTLNVVSVFSYRLDSRISSLPLSILSILHLIWPGWILVSIRVDAVVFGLFLLLLDSLLEPRPGLGSIEQPADEQSPKTLHGVLDGRQEKAGAAIYLRRSLSVSVCERGNRGRRVATGHGRGDLVCVGGWRQHWDSSLSLSVFRRYWTRNKDMV